MKKLTPFFLALLTAVFFYIGCSDNSGPTITNNNNSNTNHSPETPKNPVPHNDTTNVPRIPTLSWVCQDPDAGDTVKFDVLLDDNDPPQNTIASGITASTFSVPYLLGSNSVYFWRVNAKDNHGATTNGPVWAFTTGTRD